MNKRILFLVVGSQNTINDATKLSIQPNLRKEDAVVYIPFEDPERRELYYTLLEAVNKRINTVDNFDYVCLLPNGSTMNESAHTIFDYHQLDREEGIREVYLPFVLYTPDDLTVVLNKQVWNSMLSYSPGILDIDLALKQIDSSVFGSFVPTDMFFDAANYAPEVQYYQQYHMLSNFTDGDNIVMGIPKIFLTITDWDFKMDDLSDEDKMTSFNAARAKWSKEKKVEETPAEVTAD